MLKSCKIPGARINIVTPHSDFCFLMSPNVRKLSNFLRQESTISNFTLTAVSSKHWRGDTL